MGLRLKKYRVNAVYDYLVFSAVRFWIFSNRFGFGMVLD